MYMKSTQQDFCAVSSYYIKVPIFPSFEHVIFLCTVHLFKSNTSHQTFMTIIRHWLPAGSMDVIKLSNRVSVQQDLWCDPLGRVSSALLTSTFVFYVAFCFQTDMKLIVLVWALCRADSPRGATHHNPLVCTNGVLVTTNTRKAEKERNQSEEGTLEGDQWKDVDSGEADAQS